MTNTELVTSFVDTLTPLTYQKTLLKQLLEYRKRDGNITCHIPERSSIKVKILQSVEDVMTNLYNH